MTSLTEKISKITSEIKNIKDTKEGIRKLAESKIVQEDLEKIESDIVQFESKIDS